MSAAAVSAPAPRRANRRTLVALALVAAFPFVGAWLLYFNPHWLPQPSAQHGTLLDPPVAVSGLSLRDLDGAPLALPDTGDADWLLLAVEPGACAETCRARQLALRQARRATGMDRARLVRVLAMAARPAESMATRLTTESPDLALALADDRLLRLAGDRPALLVADPRGDLVLHYDDTVPAEAVLKDLKRLLRISRSW